MEHMGSVHGGIELCQYFIIFWTRKCKRCDESSFTYPRYGAKYSAYRRELTSQQGGLRQRRHCLRVLK